MVAEAVTAVDPVFETTGSQGPFALADRWSRYPVTAPPGARV